MDEERPTKPRTATLPGRAEQDLREKMARHERLHEQVLQELYGLHGQPGIRSEVQMLRSDYDDMRQETRRNIREMDNKIDNVVVAMERIGDKQIPRWITAIFLAVFAVCAIAITGLTLVNTLRSGL